MYLRGGFGKKIRAAPIQQEFVAAAIKLLKKKGHWAPSGEASGKVCVPPWRFRKLLEIPTYYKFIRNFEKKRKKHRKKNKLFFAAAIWVLENEFSVGNVSVLRGRRKGDPDTKSGLGTNAYRVKREEIFLHFGGNFIFSKSLCTSVAFFGILSYGVFFCHKRFVYLRGVFRGKTCVP